MSIKTVTHLNFHGEAAAALKFYQSVFGGELNLSTYGDFGMAKDAPGAEHIVFGQVVAPNGFSVMAYDVPGGPGGPAPSTERVHGTTVTTDRFFVSVRGETVDEVSAFWAKLADGATIVEPFAPAQWSPAFGMLTDKFGTTWILDVAATY
ncbi:VOC family protein [Kribbella sandramycini]|uniref:PhnB protein n=1 Tax=Kribbella sandramycini TaxID=60450 RepID=A0A7Y4KVX8_9ACTN|nr:VOC family protein [Kribbella sandramycini]MBB6567679.1 PhnB protein [Kribbella sandramycini]NOL39720.1 VOC family protein [Kribbella sandramycini]